MVRYIRVALRALAVLGLLTAFAPSAWAQENFSIEVVGPQRFHIESELEGKASALVVGKGGPRVVTRQSADGLTTVDARIPVGGKLTLTIGNHGLTIWMNDEDNWEWEEY
jgi:hypothetical protein